MKSDDDFAKIAREFHASEKAIEEAAHRVQEQDQEDAEFYEIFGSALQRIHPAGPKYVSFSREVRQPLLDKVLSQYSLNLKLHEVANDHGGRVYIYTFERALVQAPPPDRMQR
jgi:hypothetical protein